MINHQLHGKSFEDLIKACGLFRGSSDGGRLPSASFDIEARFDREHSLPTSIKTSKGIYVSLSDARRFWNIDTNFRMIVGSYKQVTTDRKRFDVIHEFLITPAILNNLRGEVSLNHVTLFHNGISLKRFSKDKYREARMWAKEQKNLLSSLSSKIILNPKIDSKMQRRLQCSISINDLINACTQQQRYINHTDHIGDYPLPLDIISTARTFNRATSTRRIDP